VFQSAYLFGEGQAEDPVFGNVQPAGSTNVHRNLFLCDGSVVVRNAKRSAIPRGKGNVVENRIACDLRSEDQNILHREEVPKADPFEEEVAERFVLFFVGDFIHGGFLVVVRKGSYSAALISKALES
jgi:hypothetical protein